MDTRHRIRKKNEKNKKKKQQQQQKESINNNNNNKLKNKKQKKSNESIIINLEYSSSSSSTKDISCHDDHEFPNWLDLPTSLLHSILDLISSLPDLFAFSAVCTQWRSLAKYTTHHLFPPPLLLYTPKPSSSSSLRTSPLLHLKTVNKSSTSTTFPSMVSKRDLNSRNLVGYSHGYLIFAAEERVLDLGVYFHCHVLIFDIFSGREFRPPKLVNCVQTRQAILTAPLSSQSCKLLLTAYGIDEPQYSIYCCDLGANDDHWSFVEIGPRSYVDSLLVFRSQLFAILSNNRVLVFESIPPTSLKRVVNVPLPNPPIAYIIHGRYLIECNGELLLLLLTQCHYRHRLLKFEVYRFDCQNFVWVRTNSIGDWCLFLNSYGLGLLACPYPTRWGGKSNRIYVAKCGTDTLTQIPLDGSLFDWNHITCGEVMPPIFVYPRKIKSETFSINFSKGM